MKVYGIKLRRMFLLCNCLLLITPFCNGNYLSNEIIRKSVKEADYNKNVMDTTTQDTSGPYEVDGASTKTLQQNIEDYYNNVDIEFDNLDENDDVLRVFITNDIIDEDHGKSNGSQNVLDNPLNVQLVDENPHQRMKRNAKSKELPNDGKEFPDDDIEQELYEELVESYDDEEEDETTSEGEKQQENKFYRDTFMDRIIQDMNIKPHKNVVRREARNAEYSMYNKERELTGDTVLHLHSEMSDVIKSETDLKGTLFPPTNKQFVKENVVSDSYVDNIMIHPSEFIQDTTPFDSNDETQGKTRRQDDASGLEVNRNAVEQNVSEENLQENRINNNESMEDSNATFNNETDVIFAVLDSRKVLKCRLRMSSEKSIVWLKDGEKIPIFGSASSVYEITSRGDIVIKRVGREHQGKWRCEERGTGDNNIHSVDRDRDLIVMESPSPPYLEVFGRRLDPGNVFLPAREGTELMMACHVERGVPTPTLHWETSKPVHMTYKNTQGPQITSSVAAVVVRRTHHNTTISCVCQHPALNTPLMASTLLHVQYAPRFGISRTPGFGFPLKEGSAVSLKCEVDSNPPATPTWRKDEREPPVEQTDDGYLNFTSVRREHSGWYKCSATHPLGNFSSIGYFLNIRYEVESATEQQIYQQTAGGRSEENLAGGAVQLQCPPGSVGCWSRNNVPPPPSSAPVGLIRQDKQAGSYVCSGLSANEASKLHAILGEYNAMAGGAPIVYPSNASIVVRESSTVTLEGEFCTNTGEAPIRVLWLAQGRALGLPDSYNRITTFNSVPMNSTASVQCNVAKLLISDCTVGDRGEYSLVVRGRRGVGEAIFHLTVQERAPLQDAPYNGASSSLPHILLRLVSVVLYAKYITN